MNKEDIENIIDAYGNPEMSHYFQNTKNASQKTVSESVADIIQQTLQQKRQIAPTKRSAGLTDSTNFDKVIISDLHGNLQGLLTTLNAMGFIDAKGDWAGKDRHLLQLGDLIDRGPHSWETTFYLRVLQEQARSQGGRVELLIGNHEEAVLSAIGISPQNFYFIPTKTIGNRFTLPVNPAHLDNLDIETEYMKKLLTQDILSDKLTLASAEPGKDMLVVHAGIEDTLLKKFAHMKLIESGKSDVAAEIAAEITAKVPSINVHRVLKENQISTTDLANWLNQLLKSRTMGIESELHADIFSAKSGVLWTRSNIRTKVSLADMYARPPADAYIQIVGHTPTGGFDFDQNGEAEVKRVRSIVYTDTGISDGNLSAVGLRGNQIYELTPHEGPWQSRLVLDIDAVRQYDVRIHASSDYVSQLQSVVQIEAGFPRLNSELSDPRGKELLQGLNDGFAKFYSQPSEEGLKTLLQISEQLLNETKNIPELAAFRKPLKQNLLSLVSQASEKDGIEKELSTLQLLRFLDEKAPLLTTYHKKALSLEVYKLQISQANSLLDTFLEKSPQEITQEMIQLIEISMHPEGKNELCLRLKGDPQTYVFDNQSIANTMEKLHLSQSHPSTMNNSKKSLGMYYLQGWIGASERKMAIIAQDLVKNLHNLAPSAQKTEPAPDRGLEHS